MSGSEKGRRGLKGTGGGHLLLFLFDQGGLHASIPALGARGGQFSLVAGRRRMGLRGRSGELDDSGLLISIAPTLRTCLHSTRLNSPWRMASSCRSYSVVRAADVRSLLNVKPVWNWSRPRGTAVLAGVKLGLSVIGPSASSVRFVLDPGAISRCESGELFAQEEIRPCPVYRIWHNESGATDKCEICPPRAERGAGSNAGVLAAF